jgi:hypothetical protein
VVEDGGPVLAARLVGSSDETLVVPEGWSWENSITKNTFFAPNEALKDSLEYVRSEQNGLEVWRDRVTRELRYIGRPTDPTIALARRVRA